MNAQVNYILARHRLTGSYRLLATRTTDRVAGRQQQATFEITRRAGRARRCPRK